MTAVQVLLVVGVVLVVAVVALRVHLRRAHRPDDAMAEFARALEALRPADDPVRLVEVPGPAAASTRATTAPADDRVA